MEMDGNLMNVSGGFTDIQVVDEHNLIHYPNKRLIAIVHEDVPESLSKEQPYQTSPGCFSSHYYSESVLARRYKFVIGTPVTPSEIERLIDINKELEKKANTADQRVNEAVESFQKQIVEATKKLEEMKKEKEAEEKDKNRAEADLASERRRKEEEIKMRKEMADERTKAVNELRDYKAKVAKVMLLVPDRGEMSVGELVEAADVADVMGEKGERDSTSQV